MEAAEIGDLLEGEEWVFSTSQTAVALGISGVAMNMVPDRGGVRVGIACFTHYRMRWI